MAPEHPPSLVIFDAALTENDNLVGSVKYIEALPGESLRVRWNVSSPPPDFKPMGKGVVFVYTQNTQVTEIPASDDAKPDNLGDFRYRWSEGLELGIPWLMFVLILPKGYTLLNARPLPAGVKAFKSRIALYWLLKGDDFNRTQVEWQIGPHQGDLKSEIIRINNASFVEDRADIYVGELDTPREKKLLEIYTRRLQKLKEKEAFLGISVDPSILMEIEDIEERIESIRKSLGLK